MNVLFMNTPKGEHCTADMIDDAIEFIINLNAEHYEMLFSQMSEKQRITFIAIAQEGRARNQWSVRSQASPCFFKFCSLSRQRIDGKRFHYMRA